MEGIQVSTEVAGSQNQISIIRVGGFIDTTTSSEVERALNSLLKQNRYNIIIDLGNVDYISSAGWGIFISEIKSIREHNGDLKLVRMIPDVYEIFELLEFHHILDVYDSVEEAIEKFEMAARKPEAALTEEALPGQATMAETTMAGDGFSTTARAATPTGEAGSPVPERAMEAVQTSAATVPLTRRSVEDKIKYIVAQDPQLGAYKINKLLNTEKFGFTRVGWFGVRSLLNQLGLSSRKSRKRFAQEYADKL